LKKPLRTGEIPPPPLPWLVVRIADNEVVTYILNYVKQLGAGKLSIEQRVWLGKRKLGHLDAGHVGPDVITIIDYKNGGWDVEAKNNKQMLTYAATFLKTIQMRNGFA